MAKEQFIISDRNPNQDSGGGGCICDRVQQTDCKPPYVIFYANDMADMQSPHPVLCKDCLCKALNKMETEAPLTVGETAYVDKSTTDLPKPTNRVKPGKPQI